MTRQRDLMFQWTLLVSLAIAVMVFSVPSVLGAEAVFSKDGTRIYSTRGEVIDLGSRSVSKFVVPGLEGEAIRDLDRTPSGELIVLTNSGLHTWDGKGAASLAGGPMLEDEPAGVDKTNAEYWERRVYTLPLGVFPFARIEHAWMSHTFWLGWHEDLEEAPGRAAKIYATVVAEGWDAVLKNNDCVAEPWGEISIVCYRRGGGMMRWDPHRGRMLGVAGQRSFRTIRGLEFDSDGACYFGGDGDLW